MIDSYWVEEDDNDRDVTVPEDIMDISFRLEGTYVPIDHAWELSQAMLGKLPWLTDEPEAAVHQIHVAASGNGWNRPEDKAHDVLHLSRRTQLTLRLPSNRFAEAEALKGQTLTVGDQGIKLGVTKTKKLSNMTTLFSRYVVGPEDENEFLEFVASELGALDVAIKKLLCGRTNTIATPGGEIFTRSVMMADLDLRESIALQRRGLGPNRLLGCGIVIPHKGIEAVKKINTDFKD